MSDRGIRELLEDMIEALKRIENYASGINYRSFTKDTKTQDAIVRNLEIIGEATKKIPAMIRQKNSREPWRRMAGLRDILIHDYFGVNYEIVWGIVQNDLPAVLPLLKKIRRSTSL